MSNYSDVFNFFHGRRVLITGHTGFKGSWLTFILSSLGAEILGFSLPAAECSLFNLLDLSPKIKDIIGDVRDANFLSEILHSFQPEVVFHLAAQPLVRESYDDPLTTYSTNIIGSANLLDAIRLCDSVRSLVYVTSDKCYKNEEWPWGYRENDRLGGRDPYSASKAACELIFSSYRSSFFDKRITLGAASVRAGNVIGGGDFALDRIVPDCIRSIQSGSPLILRNPCSTRPWQHVLEPLSGYLLLAYHLYRSPSNYSGAWNFGPPSTNAMTVNEVASSIFCHIGRGTIEELVSGPLNHEAALLQLNCDKAFHYLGWEPRWHVKETLKQTALWYKDWLDGDDISMVTHQQFKFYFPEF